ncbi:hypothetical protein F8388_002703 [Cannabis sativa]|uniref:Uncharacterized protein n=1 Tax=Cannabis sativa TaxID=3483 RepID=A0A7J6FUG7_CANSA|nr:hypothetical protein F8388_002703 [Cannabis sativa]KAF4374406.1 hypothetical protein G4B88_026293 [Cannabis sativa]
MSKFFSEKILASFWVSGFFSHVGMSAFSSLSLDEWIKSRLRMRYCNISEMVVR